MTIKSKTISWTICLGLIGVSLSFIIFYEYVYKINWVKTDTFFQYSLKDKGVYIKIENEKDLRRLFDMQSFVPFRPYEKWKDIISTHGLPDKFWKENGIDYISYPNKGIRILYCGEQREDSYSIYLKAALDNKVVDNFITNDDLKNLIRDKGNIKRIWVCRNDQTRFFCIVSHPFIEEVYWNYTKNWGEAY